MILRFLASGVLLLGLLTLPALAAQEAVLLFPPDLTLSAEQEIKVFGFRPEKGDPVKAWINGRPGPDLEGETYLKGEVSLSPGINLLFAGGKLLRIFLLPGTKLESFRVPMEEGGALDFRQNRRHPALDDGCEGCHSLDGGKLAAKDQKEACYACHNDFSKEEEGKKVFVHQPVASGECTACHDPHYSSKPKLQRLSKGCHECHDPFPQEGSVHRPAGNGECLSCHNPHASPEPKQLVRRGNSLCLGCHKVPHSRHRSTKVRGALTRVPPDFPLEKEELSCRGCHLPHQSANELLLPRAKAELCAQCHRV